MADDPASPPAPAWLRPHGRRWRVDSGPDPVCDNPWFGVEAYQATAPTGAPANYWVQRFRNRAVGVVPLHEDGTVTLVGQWRFPSDSYSWELPEGGVPAGETPLEGARRELREEAGLEASDWRRILVLQLSNASSDETGELFLATGLTACACEPEAVEELAAARVPFREALAAAASGAIQDSLTVAGLMRVHHMAVEGELPAPLARRLLAPR